MQGKAGKRNVKCGLGDFLVAGCRQLIAISGCLLFHGQQWFRCLFNRRPNNAFDYLALSFALYGLTFRHLNQLNRSVVYSAVFTKPIASFELFVFYMFVLVATQTFINTVRLLPVTQRSRFPFCIYNKDSLIK